MTKLTRIPGFLPFVLVVFLNSFVDLGHKIIIQNTLFKAYDGAQQIWLTAVVNALILLPFILLFTPSGWLADRWPKNRVMRTAAWVAVSITLGITACYYLGLFWPAFAMTFVLAVQSAIYSPAKFGYIKELCGTDALTPANAWVQASSSIAILAGIFSFSVLFELMLATPGGAVGGSGLPPDEIMRRIAPVGWFLVLGSLLEVSMTYCLPDKRAGDAAMHFDWRQYLSGRYLKHNLHAAWDNKVIWLSIIGLGVFWGISQVLLAAFPAYVEDSLGETNTVVIQGVMAFAGIGIIAGAAIAGRIARDHVETGLIPFSALGIAATLFILPAIGHTWLHGLNFMALGLLAGMFIVPLNALIQFNAGERELGRVLAAKNFILNWIMLAGLIITVISALADAGSRAIMVALAVVALGGAIYTVWQLPQSLVRFFIGRLMAVHYRLQVIGLHNMPAQGGVLMLGNHISWIDWAMVQMASPRPVRFVMERILYERWWLKWFLDFFGVVPISRAGSRNALRAVTDLINQGQVVCLFPEGTLSKNAQLGEFKRGFELAAEGADGVILPFYLRGLWGSRFSNASEKLKESRRDGRARDVIVAFGPTLPITSNAQQVKQAVFELSVSSWTEHVQTLPTLPAAWLAVAKRRLDVPTVLDSAGTTLTNRRLIAAVLLFAQAIRRRCPERNLGILLPASSAGVIANLAGWLAGKTVVNLNYTASPEALAAALTGAGIRNVITADRFLRKLGQRGIDVEALLAGATLHRMEAIRAGIGKTRGFVALAAAIALPASFLRLLYCHRAQPEDTAAILFSSGSEGAPKGVELTHRNILANVRQIADVLNTESDDLMLSNLPLFHAFGLTATTALPLLEGIPMVCHPDPTDALGSAKAIARYRATVLCSTSSFLRLYARNRKVHPLMLESLRAVVAGAERLSPDVRDAFAVKFGKRIYEGYGATETTPVASVNVPDAIEITNWKVQTGSKPGTVGMPLPGTSFRIVDPVSLEALPTGEDGLILIGGVQVMKGYLNDPERTREAVVELDDQRWYKTGDKGHLDADGFLTVVDRYSRFAKLGGEMVSLATVEDQARRTLGEPELELCAVTLPDARKGERIALLLTGDQDPGALRAKLLAAGVNPLLLPSAVLRVASVPKLGSGKTDFAAARRLAETLLEPDAADTGAPHMAAGGSLP
ncbi:MAG: acyl-[ACP]--phospholipid O-acyltransferase [Thiohalocapsa sp.]|uniref:acyl-[ACP]--phospholipid O-acyltransferase n=1 Tax=Thiohalocapsa sp. TaxID=2497641 RepID=UPI0025FB9079|nr:acyl-[ACP]--phospholipid O-acyltransferase [Thiohalocapsa sp.]MCG6940719.1 acyl-[ACP]--phospholipid O-acyltransferase [Thiohalocapsa sp.]